MKKLFYLTFALLFTLNCFSQVPPQFRDGIILGNLNSDPTGIIEGQMYFNTTTNDIKVFNGTVWTGTFSYDVFRKSDLTTPANLFTENIYHNGGLILNGFTKDPSFSNAFGSTYFNGSLAVTGGISTDNVAIPLVLEGNRGVVFNMVNQNTEYISYVDGSGLGNLTVNNVDDLTALRINRDYTINASQAVEPNFTGINLLGNVDYSNSVTYNNGGSFSSIYIDPTLTGVGEHYGINTSGTIKARDYGSGSISGVDPPLYNLTVDTNGNFIEDELTLSVDNQIIVKQASDFGVIDSSKIYLIDGKIDMGSTQIEVPSTGIFIKGLDYFVSSLFSSNANYTMFINASGQASGNVRINNLELYTSDSTSLLFDIDNQGNFGSIEFQSVNFGTFASQTENIGELSNFRQFRTNDCAFIRILNGITFSGTWAGGFRIGDSILLSIPASGNVFQEGTGLIFQGSSVTDLNALSIDDTATVFDFQESNFSLDEGFIIDGARFKVTSNPIPNLSETSTKVYFRGRGVKNTFPGARWEVTAEAVTPLTVNVQAKALGTTTYDDLVHYSFSTDNAFNYDSVIEKDFIVTGQLVVQGGANDEVDVIIRKFDFQTSTYTDVRTFTRNISNVLGGQDIAYFDPYAPVSLDEDDRIEVWIRNNTNGNDATILNGSFVAVNVRN